MKRAWAIGVLLSLAMGMPAGANGICADTLPGQDACAGPVVIAGPAAILTGYATILAVAPVGGPLTFVNADVDPHNVVSRVADPLRRGSWCDTPLYPVSEPCPLFWSPLTETGTVQVHGLQNVEPFSQSMKTYRFFCSLHEDMEGTLMFV